MSVEIVDVPTQKVASIRKTQSSSHIGSWLSDAAIKILVYLKELGISVNGSGFAITHSRDESKGEVDIEVCVPISPDNSSLAKDRGDIKFKDVNGGQACSSTLKGSYDGLFSVEEEIRKWSKDNSKAISPEIRYVFSVSAKDGKTNPSDWVTFVQFLLQ